VIDGVLGIDVSKNTLDASMSSCNKVRARSFANSPDGWRHLLDWLITQRVRRVHACLESTGRYSLGIAGALNEAGHVVSIATKLTGSMRRTFVSIASCSNPNLGRRLRRHIAGWVSCRRFEPASSRV
jgi:hypothetical protein